MHNRHWRRRGRGPFRTIQRARSQSELRDITYFCIVQYRTDLHIAAAAAAATGDTLRAAVLPLQQARMHSSPTYSGEDSICGMSQCRTRAAVTLARADAAADDLHNAGDYILYDRVVCSRGCELTTCGHARPSAVGDGGGGGGDSDHATYRHTGNPGNI